MRFAPSSMTITCNSKDGTSLKSYKRSVYGILEINLHFTYPECQQSELPTSACIIPYVNMPHPPEPTSSDPLLASSSKLKSDGAIQTRSPTTRTAIKALTFFRIATGAACLFAPRFTCAVFLCNVPVEQAWLVRFIGARDIVFGERLITTDDIESDHGRRQVRHIRLLTVVN
jgi:hypothetical protein